MNKPRQWTVEPTWKGEDAFILCGGTSLNAETIQRLKGRPHAKTIAINTSYLVAPWADMLFFADDRWWKREHQEHRGELLKTFSGQIVTTARHTKDDLLLHLHRIVPTPGAPVSTDPSTVALEKTSLTGVLNLCVFKGVRRVILIGADNRDGAKGRIHHHAEYPWARALDSWKFKETELGFTVKPLEKAGIEVINASPESSLPFWRKVDFETWLNTEGQDAQR